MTITQSQIDQLLTLVRQTYPGWQNFNHPRFVAEQIDAQQTAAGLMRNLARPEFERLLRQNLYTEIVSRLDQVARAATLLDLTESASSDLGILTSATVNQGELCRQLFNLLYGNAAIEVRLQHYLAFVSKQDNSLNHWAFPTYFLFLVHPDREMFVNPSLTERYLTWFGVADGWSPQPSVEAYVKLVAFVQQLQRALKPYAPHDLIDLQGLLQVAFRQPQQPWLTAEKRAELATLFQQFLATYPQTDEGRYHIANYQANRLEAERNYAAIVAAREHGEDVTDRVLLQLLPYANNSRNRASGAWIHLAPTINGDLRKWYEASGWTKPADWPAVATAILDFITQCVADPAALSTACATFTALPYSKGFQSGQLTPILNALRPAAFVLINNKSRQVLNYLTGEQFESTLRDYPAANAALQQLHRELADLLKVPALNLSPGDTFDMFCHWLVAVHKFSFKDIHYWKIAPGENAWQWTECLEGNFIAIGWDELGDLTTMSQSEFNIRRDSLLAQNPDWGRSGVNQVWDFAKKIHEGDRIVANRGTTEILGIGTVTGPYYFVPNVRSRHRLPVEWDDTTLRKVNQGGWRKTLISLDFATFTALVTAAPRPPEQPLAVPFAEIFTSKAAALWAFDLILAALTKLGITTAADERIAVTLPDERALHINVGNWLVLGFQRDQIRLPFLAAAGIDEQYRDYTFAQAETDQQVIGYRLPVTLLQPFPVAWQASYDEALAIIADRVSKYVRSPWRKKHHVPALAAAIFDPTLREELLVHGLPSTEEHPTPVPNCPFTQTTFDLLAQLHAEPTSAFYSAHKADFTQQVEEPFKRVLLEVGRRLPEAIREVMETEKRIFARFTKNDWGQGGVWDFYWGAFYPKGSKRSQDAQLSMWMNYSYLEFGFYIGNYGSEQRLRFQRNCERNAGPLSDLMSNLFRPGEIILGPRDEFTVTSAGVTDLVQRTWADFMRNPTAANCDVSVVIPAPELLRLTFEELVQRIVHTHQRLFPLVLAAIEEDPMPAIGAYLEPSPEETDDETGGGTPPTPPPPAPYKDMDFLQETFLRSEDLNDLLDLLADKRQLILYGPPGTGKTFIAQHLARLLTGLAQPGPRVQTIQFHPAYGYEDFIEGIRPESKLSPTGQQVVEYPVVAGRFREFCERAARHDPAIAHVFIIDEINRGNLPRIFGELLYLLEYRGESITLPYSGKPFQIPPNVYLIGTMNTADRSIALVDFALRRRFNFVPLLADPDLFDRWLAAHPVPIPYLGTLYRRLCKEAIEDPNYQIGPSYFMQPALTEHKLAHIWRYSIEPLLQEYYAENAKKAAVWAWRGELLQTICNG